MEGESKLVNRGSSSRAWLVYLLVGILATGTYFFLLPSASVQNVFYDLVGFSSVAALIVGVRLHRPTHPLQWYVLAFGLSILVFGEVIFSYYENVLGIEAPFPSVADAFYLIAMPCIAAGLVLMHRRYVPGRQWANLIDALIVATVAGMLSWVFLMEPQAYDQSRPLLERLISIAYPLMDLIVLVAALQLWLISKKKGPLVAHYLLSISLVFLLLSDTWYATTLLTDTYETGHPLDGGWLLFYVLFGAAALHPSMVGLSESGAHSQEKLTWGRLVLLTGTSLIAPILLIYQGVFKEEIDVPVIAGGSVVLFVLVAARMAGMISYRRRAEESLKTYATRLQQSNRELRDFANAASHDLQEPLRKVRTFSDRLKSKYADALDEQGHDYLQRMESAAARMQDLIDDLLTLSRVTTQARPFESVDLGEVAKEVLSDLEARIEHSGGQVEVGEMPTVEADRAQMHQLLQNLIGNALKFHKEGEGPVVKIHNGLLKERKREPNGSSKNGGACQIVVEDNGIGFDEEHLERIFAPFQRLHGRAAYEGTGMGLAICRKVVERHGGEITAKSAPGRGAAFIVTLPVKQLEKKPGVKRGEVEDHVASG